MLEITEVLELIRLRQHLDAEEICTSLHLCSDAQAGAIIAGIKNSPKYSEYDAAKILGIARKRNYDLIDLDNRLSKIKSTEQNWDFFCRTVVDRSLSDFTLGGWLMAVTLNGLDINTTNALTKAMASSGQRYDYREELRNAVFLRRYPTGALSEKIALIMPVVLLYLKETLKIHLYSPFLIARVLGHTGGTRDKLAVFDGVKIPQAGDATLEILKNIGVCYTATSEYYNPADDRIYSLRSETNTIESDSLIISSIASKMLACPVDLMQIDARWGSGAFFADQISANKTSKKICELISTETETAFHTVTEANFPDGSGLGAHAEIAEAISVLSNAEHAFDFRAIVHQQMLVADFTARLVAEAFNLRSSDVYAAIMTAFRTKKLKSCFIKLFSAHGADESFCVNMWNDPFYKLKKLQKTAIVAKKDGRLIGINQRRFGEFLKKRYQDASIIMHVRPHDKITTGKLLMELYSLNISSIQEFDDSWFHIE